MLLRYEPAYHTWTTAELITSVKARVPGTPKPDYPRDVFFRKFYINFLKKLDENVKFEKFFDLPPELRIRIYEYIVTHNRDREQYADTAILRASKQLHHEGSDVMHSESIMFLRGRFNGMYPGSDGDVQQRRRFEGRWFRLNPAGQRKLESTSWYVAMSHLRNLHIEVELETAGLFGRYWPEIDVKWWKLSLWLQDVVDRCKRLRHIKIVMPDEAFVARRRSDDAENYRGTKMIQTLLPLKGLPEECTLHVRGLDKQTYKAFWSEITKEDDATGWEHPNNYIG